MHSLKINQLGQQNWQINKTGDISLLFFFNPFYCVMNLFVIAWENGYVAWEWVKSVDGNVLVLIYRLVTPILLKATKSNGFIR